MLLRFGRSVWRSGQGCFLAKTGPRARRESSGVGCLCLRLGLGEARSRPLSGPSLGLIAPIRPLRLSADGGYQLRLGVLGVPLIMVPDTSIEPYRVEDALRDSDWVLAMQEELNNFTRNEVWHLVPRPNQNVVGTKWVFRNKQDEHGVVIRNKARLCGQGLFTSRRFGFQ
jgi:hypothetical protein